MDYLQYLDIFDELENEEPPRKKKVYKRRYDPFSLEDDEFKGKYRFTKTYARDVVELIRGDIEQNGRGGGVSAELQVCTALRTWARQEVQDDAADLHGLSQQSITNICRRVAVALASRAEQFIYMPQTLPQQGEVIAEFRNM